MRTICEPLRDLMTPDPLVLDDQASLDHALKVLHDSLFRHLPVVGAGGELVGILSDRDLRLATSLVPSGRRTRDKDGRRVPGPQLVSEIMRSPVHSLPSDASSVRAASDMVERRIGAIPIVDGERLVGIFTETDVLRAFLELNRDRGGTCNEWAEEHMHSPMTWVSPDASVEDALELMDEGIGHLGVLDEGELTGIVSGRDIFGGIARSMIRDAKAQSEGRMEDATTSVADVMTLGVFTVGPQATLCHCARGMIRYRVGALPVLQDGTPIGMLTQRNIIEYFASIA